MLSAYPACFLKDESGYSVIFPDLNYLATCGHTLEEAFEMAVDCLAGYLYTAKKEGENIPSPSALQSVDLQQISTEFADESVEEQFVNIVTVDVDDYAKRHFERSVKKTLTIPAWLNDAALERNINFSQVLQEALKAQLHM